SKILWTIAAFSAAATPRLPAGDEPVDMSTLGLREGGECDEAPHLLLVVILDGRLEVLALGCRLAQLPAQPAKEAHGGLIRHAAQAIVARASVLGGLVRCL